MLAGVQLLVVAEHLANYGIADFNVGKCVYKCVKVFS
jgi:hypothetical protein